MQVIQRHSFQQHLTVTIGQPERYGDASNSKTHIVNGMNQECMLVQIIQKHSFQQKLL